MAANLAAGAGVLPVGQSNIRPVELHPPGTVLAGRYEIVRLLGRGGFGAVYQASGNGRMVAIKQRIDAISGIDSEYLETRFEAECRMLEKLEHPAIPRIFEHFKWEDSGYLVMAFIPGQAADDWLHRTHPSVEDILRLGVDICQVLEYLHGQPSPIMHRDIKPPNIIVQDDGKPVLVDFGLARVLDLGQTSTQVGTIGYAPLEQVRGKPEPCSDIYSLGATLYHLLTGQAPQPFAIARLEPSTRLSARVCDVVAMATQQNPGRRFLTATRMRQALEGALAELRGEAVQNFYPDIAAPGRRPWFSSPWAWVGMALVAAGAADLWFHLLLAPRVAPLPESPTEDRPVTVFSLHPEDVDSVSRSAMGSLLASDSRTDWVFIRQAHADAHDEFAVQAAPQTQEGGELELGALGTAGRLPLEASVTLEAREGDVDAVMYYEDVRAQLVFSASTGRWRGELDRLRAHSARTLSTAANPLRITLQLTDAGADLSTADAQSCHLDAPIGASDGMGFVILPHVDRANGRLYVRNLRITHPPARRRVPWHALLALGMMLAGVLVFAWSRRRRPPG
ncbi:MAG TPA: serine/threonine-protein kinase [Candidatus Xenobia bacterium]|jgi:serine/threonine-protein kinase